MNSAERAQILRLATVEDEADRIRREEHEAQAKRKHGNWQWRFIGEEIHLRNKTLPTLRLDMLRPEASDLIAAVAKALNEKRPSQPRISKREREAAKKHRGAWNRANAAERANAMKLLAEEFAERGGW